MPAVKLLCFFLTVFLCQPVLAGDCMSETSAGRFAVHCHEMHAEARIEGRWLMIEGDLAAPQRIDNAMLESAQARYLPGRLLHSRLFEKMSGVATLIADIRFLQPGLELELAPGWINSSHRIFVRDRSGQFVKVFENADLESLADDEAGQVSTRPVPLPELGEQTRIVVHMHNGPYISAGVPETLALAPAGQLSALADQRRLVHAVLVSLFLLLAFYNLFLCFYHRNHWEGLLLFLIALGLSLRNFTLGGLLEALDPPGSMKLYLYTGWFTFLGAMFLLPLYFRQILAREFKAWMAYLCSVPVGIILIASLFIPLADFISIGMQVRNFSWLPMLLGLFATLVAAWRRTEVGLVTLLGMLLMVSATLLDISYYSGGKTPLIEFANVGYLIFLALQSIIVTRRRFQFVPRFANKRARVTD